MKILLFIISSFKLVIRSDSRDFPDFTHSLTLIMLGGLEYLPIPEFLFGEVLCRNIHFCPTLATSLMKNSSI